MFWLRREVSHPTPKRGEGQRCSLSKGTASQPHSWPTGGKTKLSGWGRERTLARVGAEMGIPTTGGWAGGVAIAPSSPETLSLSRTSLRAWLVSAGVREFGIPPKLPLLRQR